MESYDACLTIAAILLNSVGWSLGFVYKVWIENIKFISLYNLRRRVVMIIMSLVIFVPLISSVNTVEIFWLSGPVFVMPPINLHKKLSIMLEILKRKNRITYASLLVLDTK